MARRSGDVTRSAVLARLGASGPASRAQLARELDVSPALLTQLSKSLIDEGLVRELDDEPSSGGRPGRLLGLVADGGRAVGIKVAHDHLALVEVGIDGSVLRSSSIGFRADAATTVGDLVRAVGAFVDEGEATRVLGIGLGIPGSVDNQAIGTVDSPTLGWSGVQIGTALRFELGHPVLIENDVTALAVAERLYGIGRDHDDFLVITIGTGIGAALVSGGSVLRGATGGLGEIGHIPVVEDGPICSCGNRGCLESLIGDEALLSAGRELGILGGEDGFEALVRLADAGDGAATHVFADAGHRLGRALAGVVNTLDPGMIVLLGEGSVAWPHWSYGFEPAFRSSLLPTRRSIPVVLESWSDEAWARGAAALVLATPYDAAGQAGEQGQAVRARLSSVIPAP